MSNEPSIQADNRFIVSATFRELEKLEANSPYTSFNAGVHGQGIATGVIYPPP